LVCIQILAALFFVVHLVVNVTKTIMLNAQFAHPDRPRVAVKIVRDFNANFNAAIPSVHLSPMLCVLFLGARIRALQIDPVRGNPQGWAQLAFYCCTFAVVTNVIVQIVLPFVHGGPVKEDQTGNSRLNKVENIVQLCLLLMIYGCAIAVVMSVYLISHPTDPELTPPVPPAMQCVIWLASLYILAYTALFVCETVVSFARENQTAMKCTEIFDAGTKTLMLAPMLGLLFLAARIRANQLTMAEDGTIPPEAGPQPWAQICMHSATNMLTLQYILSISVPWVLGTGDRGALKVTQLSEDGIYRPPSGTSKIVGIVLWAITYLCMISMYGSACAIIAAIFTMTPENLPPYVSQIAL